MHEIRANLPLNVLHFICIGHSNHQRFAKLNLITNLVGEGGRDLKNVEYLSDLK